MQTEVEMIVKVFKANSRDIVEHFGRCVSSVELISAEKEETKKIGMYGSLEEQLSQWRKLVEENVLLIDKLQLHFGKENLCGENFFDHYEQIELMLATQLEVKREIEDHAIAEWPSLDTFRVLYALMYLQFNQENTIQEKWGDEREKMRNYSR